MRSRQYLQSFKVFPAAVMFAAAAVLVLDGSAYAQRGKGHGRPGGGPPGHQKHGGPPQRGGQAQRQPAINVQRQAQRNAAAVRAQQMQVRNVQRQQRQAPPQAARQQQYQIYRQAARQRQLQYQNYPGAQQQRQQQQNYLKAQRQQQINAWNVQRQRQMMSRRAQRQQQMMVRQAAPQRQQQWTNRRNTARQQQMFANRARNRQTRAAIDRAVAIPARRRQAVQIVPGNFWTGQQTAWTGVSRVDRWQRNQRQNWKSERKARRQFMKDRRHYDRSRNTAFDPGYYSNFGNNYFLNAYRYDRPSWKVRLVQTVIGSFIYRGGGSYDTYDGYDSRRYSPEVYYAEDVPRYHNSPMYAGYSPRYVDGPDYYSDADYEDDDFDLSGMLGQLPIGELIANFAGDGFVSDLLSNLLAQGYDEGFMAGQAALEYGYGDDTYDNPYVFEGGFCDPYSASLGENRELLSEGYTLGYQDALNGRDDYDPYSDGSADLVSVLLSEALGGV